MILLREAELPPGPLGHLNRFQAEIDSEPDYGVRVEKARSLWAAKTRSARSTFRTIRETLTTIHRDDPRCVYCGYSLADEIDHFRPKTIYPELVFVWENFLHACRQCNGFKADKFAVFPDEASIQPTVVTRGRNAPVAPPISGESVLIDPRRENPMDFLLIDLIPEPASRLPYLYRPHPNIDERQKTRALFTIETIGLNSRDYLRRGRASAFDMYRAGLADYVVGKTDRVPVQDWEDRIAAFKDAPHRAVWEEMKRWHRSNWLRWHPRLRPISDNFDAAPEALDW